MAQYVYDLAKQADVDKLVSELENIEFIFSTKRFKSYIADKCLDLLKQICDDTDFWEEHSVWASKVEQYKNGHKVQIGNDYVLIFNDTYYSPDELWWLSDNLKANYANGLSVSYLIEYGMGIRGLEQDDWQTNVKKRTEDNWFYKNPDIYPKGTAYFSREGKLIYLKLAMEVEQRIEDWINEYLGKETK